MSTSEDNDSVHTTCCNNCGLSFEFDEPVSAEDYHNGDHQQLCPACEAEEAEEEEPVRKVLYKGGTLALATYRVLGANDVCCGICHEKRAEHEAAQREEAPTAAMGGGGGGGGAEVPPGEPAEAMAIKASFVVPLCATHVAHLYHRTCLKGWLKRPDHSTCPMCQTMVVHEGTPTHSVPQSQVSSLEAPTPPAPPAQPPLLAVEVAILDACMADMFAVWLHPPPADLVLANWDHAERGYGFTVETAATNGNCGSHCVSITPFTQATFIAIRNQIQERHGDWGDEIDGTYIWNA